MNIKQLYINILFLALAVSPCLVAAQSGQTLPANATLQQCIDFALSNRASVQQAVLDEEIGEREIASALSGWFPQINANATYNRNIIIPTLVIGDQIIRAGQNHTSALVLQAD